MSIFKNFRNYNNQVADFNTLSSRYDQPTYLSFKLEFAGGKNLRDSWYNVSNEFSNYDKMPHPLFANEGTEGVNDRQFYSAIDYLLDANEFTRAKMLKEFIEKFYTLQDNFQWYFQKIEGIGELLKIDPKKGMRVTSDKRLTITALEGLDLRMSHILNLYRKIAWDDTYQRWVLPDMMRYFTLKIYVTEFRTFHVPSLNPTPNQEFYVPDQASTKGELMLSLLDDIMPTWVINCEMCEFDLENLEYKYLENLGIDVEPETAGIKFGIKVGKIYEEQIYPIFKNMYLKDKLLNGFDRAKSSDIDKDTNETVDFDSTSEEANLSANFKGTTWITQGKMGFTDHLAGLPYNQATNSTNMFGIPKGGPGVDGKFFTNDDIKVNSTDPDTWLGNALDFGTSFATNLGKQYIDKAKITPILGISYIEVASALKSKNIISSLGLLRKSINTVTSNFVQPSELLEGEITDDIFRSFLTGISRSTATTELNQNLQDAAITALNNEGIWGQIKDFSLATDLVGKGEENIKKEVQGGNYKEFVDKQSGNDRSWATDLDGGPKLFTKGIIESIPTSKATSGKINEV